MAAKETSKTAKQSKDWMRNFSVGTKGGRRVVSDGGAVRFKDDEGKMVQMASGDIGPVPDGIINALNSGEHKVFVSVPKKIPVVGTELGKAGKDE